MKGNLTNVLTALLCLGVLSAALLSAGCTQSSTTQAKDATIPELKALNALAEDRLFSINWNAEHPGNIRSQLQASETDFKNIFDILSAKSPTSEYESYTIYTMRTIDCTYIDMIAAMMDLTNVLEQNNNAEYYAAMYDSTNWEVSIRNADDALVSARNNLYSAEYRLSGINTNMVPLDMQGEVTELKVRIDQMKIVMNNLAEEFATALS